MTGLVATSPLVERLDGDVDLLSLAAAGAGLRQLLTVQGWSVALSEPLAIAEDLQTLGRLADVAGWRDTRDAGLPPFTGGLAGYLSDDLSPALLSLPPDRRPAVAPLAPMAFGLYDSAVCRAPDGSLWLLAADLPGLSRTPASHRLAELRRRVAGRRGRPADAPAAAVAGPASVRASLERDAHRRAVHRTLEWIGAGDLYQLNLTTQFRAPWRSDGETLARHLWAATPGAAHAGWIGTADGVEIVSASPETLLRVSGSRAVVRPVKGTRPRRAEPAADTRERELLRNAAKDAAEHVMIVDLERNDLGRVAVPGTVRVPALAAVEAHPTVWHLTSTVEAALRPDAGLAEVLAAVFPGGSVTGAPKRMAVERIARLEPVRRGVYCGAIGVISRGLVDLSVAIRTAVTHDGWAHYGAGGGIVADSDAAEEWQELLHKAEAFFVATGARPR